MIKKKVSYAYLQGGSVSTSPRAQNIGAFLL